MLIQLLFDLKRAWYTFKAITLPGQWYYERTIPSVTSKIVIDTYHKRWHGIYIVYKTCYRSVNDPPKHPRYGDDQS